MTFKRPCKRLCRSGLRNSPVADEFSERDSLGISQAGPPKGMQISHANSAALLRGFNEVVPLPVNGRVISWLPAAHIAERNVNDYIPMDI